MKFGAVIPHHEIGADAGAMRAFVQGVESLGADHLLLYDHVLGADPDREGGFRGPYDKDVQFHEPFTTFAFIAALTSRVELMPTVMILPQRQTALVAKQAAEVAILSDNRFRLGIGTGWNEVEYEALNEDFTNRGKRQAEQVELLRKLWTEDSLSFDGDYHRVSRAGINPRPTQSIPIWFGGSAPALLRRCARLGDGWVPVMGPNPEAAEAVATIRAMRAEYNLPWEGFGIQAQAQYAGGNPERWANHAEKWRKIGATHLAVVTQNDGAGNVDGHIARVEEYLSCVSQD
jgi:probable F420-dependent oxidoreductase